MSEQEREEREKVLHDVEGHKRLHSAGEEAPEDPDLPDKKEEDEESDVEGHKRLHI